MIWAVQDVFFAYMLKTTQLKLAQLPDIPDNSYSDYPVIFHVYSLVFDEPTAIYHLTLSSVYGGTSGNVMGMLRSSSIPKIEIIEKAIETQIIKNNLKTL